MTDNLAAAAEAWLKIRKREYLRRLKVERAGYLEVENKWVCEPMEEAVEMLVLGGFSYHEAYGIFYEMAVDK